MKHFYAVFTAIMLTGLAAAAGAEAGFVSLFNGTDLNGWDGNPKFWSVRDGAITGQTTAENPTQGNTFLIYRDGEVDDFELRLQYKIIGGNSGIQYRSRDLGDWAVGGYQADFEAGTRYSGILYEERGRGILANRGQVVKVLADSDDPQEHRIEVIGSAGESEDIQSVIKNEDWNDYTIIAKDNQLVHLINGRVTSICLDEQAEKFTDSGILALQLHAGPPMTVQFRDIRIRYLNPPDVTGTWDFTTEANGQVYESVFELNQEASNLSGHYEGGLGRHEVSGSISGRGVDFSFTTEMNGQDATFHYTGSVKNPDEMGGTLSISDFADADWTAKKR